MSLHVRYNGASAAGLRLDNLEYPQQGRALDMGRSAGGQAPDYTMWVRAHDGRDLVLDGLTVADVAALRDGLSNMLAYDGHEQVIEVNVPKGVAS